MGIERRVVRVVRVAIAAVIVVGLSGCGQSRWHSRLASANAAGTDSGDQSSWSPELTPDGTRVVFTSHASNLGPTDTNHASDIYVRDLTTGVTELVSVNAAGTDSGNGESRLPRLSPDGTKVVFRSRATDLASPFPSATYDQLYVRDLTTGTTTLISVNADVTGGGDGDSADDMFTPDGTKLLFTSSALDLVRPPSEVRGGTFERDLTTGTTVRLAPGYAGVYSPSGDALAYVSQEVMLRDLATGTEIAISAGRPGTTSGGPVFSHDGNRIAFQRETQVNGIRNDIYVYDRTTHTVTLVTAAVVGGGGSNGFQSAILGFHPSDANKLLFMSEASNLVANDTNGVRDVFVRDLAARTTTPVARRAGSSELSVGGSRWACWLPDGTKVAFVSSGSDLGPHDTNSALDIYVRDLGAGTNQLVSTNGAGDDSANRQSGEYKPIVNVSFFVYELSVSADGQQIAFGSDASDLGPTDTPRLPSGSYENHDVYVANLVTPSPS